MRKIILPRQNIEPLDAFEASEEEDLAYVPQRKADEPDDAGLYEVPRMQEAPEEEAVPNPDAETGTKQAAPLRGEPHIYGQGDVDRSGKQRMTSGAIRREMGRAYEGSRADAPARGAARPADVRKPAQMSGRAQRAGRPEGRNAAEQARPEDMAGMQRRQSEAGNGRRPVQAGTGNGGRAPQAGTGNGGRAPQAMEGNAGPSDAGSKRQTSGADKWCRVCTQSSGQSKWQSGSCEPRSGGGPAGQRTGRSGQHAEPSGRRLCKCSPSGQLCGTAACHDGKRCLEVSAANPRGIAADGISCGGGDGGLFETGGLFTGCKTSLKRKLPGTDGRLYEQCA